MTRSRAVVFDLDDTLYPERDFVLGGFGAVAAWGETHLGIPKDEGYRALLRMYEDGVRGDTFDRWLGARGIDPGPIVPQLVDAYRRHAPRIAPFPGVPAMLGRLRAGHRVGLVSDGFLAVQRRKLDALGIGSLFDAVVFSDEWGRDGWKPSPAPFLAALERLGVAADSAVYVGDNPLKDFLGARLAGMRTVQVRRPGGEYCRAVAPTKAHEADRVLRDLDELERLLASWPGADGPADGERGERRA
ncbi:MAG TPA: HAD family hydrolase [Vicinamibacterales bacterium]|nr:HAD family hydrolase [Vicinamibacterales bacterium]HPW21059.1 HAD family hydrolase [Vicinamibacterales bacterium]